MWKITKEFSFSAAHYLNGLRKDHPCARVHGHNYVIKIELTATKLNDVGFVLDYRELDNIKTLIDENYDHRCLNNAMRENPTAENLAKSLFLQLHELYPQLSAVEVSETPKTNARYTPDYDNSTKA